VAAVIANLKNLNMGKIAPYSARQARDLAQELARRAGETTTTTQATLSSFSTADLRAALQRMASAEFLGSFVCTLILTLAIQALVAEISHLIDKVTLQKKLTDNLAQQQSAQLPDLGNLLYHDIRGEIALYPSDYEPTDQVDLERMMGSQEIYRAFLLATVE
jgi:hypothetical protein